MERGRGRGGRGRGAPRGRGGRGGRGRGDYGGRGRGGRGGPTHLTDLAWDEALQSIKENKISNLQKILLSYPQLLNQVKKNSAILLEAINEGNMEAINMLLEQKNININIEAYKRTPLDFAAKNNLEELVWLLSSKNAKGKPFLSAMEGGHAKLAAQLMKRLYSDPKEAARDHRGDYTLPVHFAGSVECLKLVLPHSDVNAVSYMYGTPLQAAIAFKHFEVAEYLVEHVPDVDFEPESWINSIVGQSPLFLALVAGHRPLVEKLLNSGKCQRTLDSTIGCPTPEEYLILFDNNHAQSSSETKSISTKPGQKVTYVASKVTKEQYLNSIFKILNVPEEERVITYEDPTKPQTEEPKEQDSIYNYPSLEECPSSLLRDFLTSRKIQFDPNTLHNELVEKVKDLKIKIENTTPEAQKDESTDILIDRETLNAIPDFIPFKDLKGYFERDDRQHFLKLDITNQKGSAAFLDLKTPGVYSIHRTHFFNQNSLYQSKIVLLMGRPSLNSTTRLSEGLAYRLVGGVVRDSFDSKLVVEKLEPGMELFYGEVHFQDHENETDDFGGRIFVNNGRTFVFFSALYDAHLEKMSAEFGVDTELEPDSYEDDLRIKVPLPRMPYTFYVGEMKVKPGANDIKEGAVIEGVWWETNLEKYSVPEVFNEENFCRKGKWRIVSPFSEQDGPQNPQFEVDYGDENPPPEAPEEHPIHEDYWRSSTN